MAIIIRIVVALAALASACLGVSAADRAASPVLDTLVAGKRVALVVGNGAYDHAPALPNPRNDASDIADLLRGLGFEVVEGVDLDKRAFEERIVEFSERADGAEATLFYYAGHGMQVDGRNYLLPVDAALEKKAALPFQTVPVDTILRFMTARNRVAIALLDACRDNPLSRRFALTRSASAGRGLAMPATGGGIMIGFATAPGETAADGDGRNSPFAAALLRHLGQPQTEIGRTMKLVMADVSATTGDRQRPWVHSDIAVDFYMVPDGADEMDRKAPASTTADEAPAEEDLEIASLPESAAGSSSSQATTAVRSHSRRFGVFENQDFDLCGYSGFKASVTGSGSGGKPVSLTSLDRSIPDRSFRGYSKSLPLETPVRLWDDCTVEVSRDARAGVTRLTFSVSSGR